MRRIALFLAAVVALLFVGLSIAHGGGHLTFNQMLADASRYGPLTVLFGMAIPAFCPTSQFAKFSTVVIPTVSPTTQVLTTGGGVVTGTTTQALSGLLRMSTTNAQTWNTPTAAQIVAAINGCQVGNSFDLDIINYGASTLTIGLGAGVTTLTVATVAPVLTVVTLASKRLRFVVTNVTPGSEAVDLYAFGSIAAAVA